MPPARSGGREGADRAFLAQRPGRLFGGTHRIFLEWGKGRGRAGEGLGLGSPVPGVTGPSGLLAAVAGFKRIGVTFQTELPKVERPWGPCCLLLPERFPRRLNYLTKLLGEKIPSLWDSKESLRNTRCSSLCKGGAASPGWSSPTLKAEAWGKVSRRQENNGDITEVWTVHTHQVRS